MSLAKVNGVGDGWQYMGQWSNNSDREKLKYVKKSPSVTLSTKIPIQTDLGLNLGLHASSFKNDGHSERHGTFTR